MRINSSLVNNWYKFFIIVLCFFSMQIVAMKKQDGETKTEKNKKLYFGRGSHQKFQKNGHYVSSGRLSADKIMCLYCGLVVCRSDRGRTHACNSHDIDWKIKLKKQDSDKIVFPDKCRYTGCDFEFNEQKSFLEHVNRHIPEFKEAHGEIEDVTKEDVTKEDASEEDASENYVVKKIDRKRKRDSDSLRVVDRKRKRYSDKLEELAGSDKSVKFDKLEQDLPQALTQQEPEYKAMILSPVQKSVFDRLIELKHLKNIAGNKLVCGDCGYKFFENNLVEEILPHFVACSLLDKKHDVVFGAKALVDIGQKPESKRVKLK